MSKILGRVPGSQGQLCLDATESFILVFASITEGWNREKKEESERLNSHMDVIYFEIKMCSLFSVKKKKYSWFYFRLELVVFYRYDGC